MKLLGNKAWSPLVFVLACAPSEVDEPTLATPMAQRLRGDRTGACVSAALIADGEVRRASVCAGERRALDADTAFEIGSITKTMTGVLLASLVSEGQLSLDDPLSKFLPAGSALPSFEGQPILLKHLVTHTAGLPALPTRMKPSDAEDPYADLTPQVVIDSLADVQLAQAPGSAWAYSNWGFMLLSYVLTERTGMDFESLLRTRLFSPLGMRAFLTTPPAGVTEARGHASNAAPAKAWTFPVQLAGLGGVRATLDDMVHYAQAVLRADDASIALATTPILKAENGPEMAMGWIREALGGAPLWFHDGGTAGFSSVIAIDREHNRALVALSDTSFGNVGGLTELAAHLLDPDAIPLEAPRTVVPADPALVNALAGRYVLAGMNLELSARAGALVGRVEGQGELTFSFDSRGDFFSNDVDVLLTPVPLAGGLTTFDFKQGGGVLRAERQP